MLHLLETPPLWHVTIWPTLYSVFVSRLQEHSYTTHYINMSGPTACTVTSLQTHQKLLQQEAEPEEEQEPEAAAAGEDICPQMSHKCIAIKDCIMNTIWGHLSSDLTIELSMITVSRFSQESLPFSK